MIIHHNEGDNLLFVKGEQFKNWTWRDLRKSHTIKNIWFNNFKQADMWFNGYAAAKLEDKHK
jgi:hypothetical protein